MPDNEAKDKPDKIPLTFFETNSCNEPVREWLLDMDQDDRQEIGRDLARVQFRFPVGMPPYVALLVQDFGRFGRVYQATKLQGLSSAITKGNL